MDSLEELESYLQSVDEVASTPIEETVKVSKPTQTIPNNTFTLYANRGSNISDHHLFNWYNPFAGFDGITLLCWNNVYMGYTYKFVNNKPRFVSVDSVKSYLSGIKLTTWEQNGYDKTFKKTNSTKDTVELTVDGYYILGFEVKGLCIGAKRNGTWTCTLNLE